MNKFHIALISIAFLRGLGLLIWFISLDSICYDKGGRSEYFTKKYYLANKESFSNHSQIIPEEMLIAKYVESGRCNDKGSHFINGESKLKNVDREEFEIFIEEYNRECSNCLLSEHFYFGKLGVFEVASGKHICNRETQAMNLTECISIPVMLLASLDI